MRLRFLRPWIRSELPTVEPGAVLDVPDLVGRALIADGRAVPAETPVEVATLRTPETAARTARPEGRARGG